MEKHTVPFFNKSIVVNVKGNLNSSSILFIHGNSMSSKIWKKQFLSHHFEQLALLSIDLPGHGESDDLDSYVFKKLAEVIPAVIEHFKLSNYVLVGNSLGGDLILQIVDGLDGCKGIMLINTPPVGKPPEMEKGLLPNPLAGMFFSNEYDSTKVPVLSESMFFKTTQIPKFIISDFKRTDGAVRASLIDAVGKLEYTDEVEVLKNLKCPVAIVCGTEEKIVNNDYYLTLNIPYLYMNTICLIKNAAHCPQWENEDDFNSLLFQFVTAVLN